VIDCDSNVEGWYAGAGMLNTSFRDSFCSYWGFYGSNYNATDPADSDFSDERLKAFATSKLAVGRPFARYNAEPIIDIGPRESIARVLGPHGSACDIFGAWMDDPDAALKHALGLGNPFRRG